MFLEGFRYFLLFSKYYCSEELLWVWTVHPPHPQAKQRLSPSLIMVLITWLPYFLRLAFFSFSFKDSFFFQRHGKVRKIKSSAPYVPATEDNRWKFAFFAQTFFKGELLEASAPALPLCLAGDHAAVVGVRKHIVSVLSQHMCIPATTNSIYGV